MSARTAVLAVVGLVAGAGSFALARVGGEHLAALDAAVPHGLAIPDGMVWVPGGRTRIGDDAVPGEGPSFLADVRPFLMDAAPVTVGEFRRFVAATGHVTAAEREGGGVYDERTDAWAIVRGAVWHHPSGPDAPAAAADHPVTQVSWHDAVAYARWAGKRLPTEVEWEHAARGGVNRRARYAWGDSLRTGAVHHANTWQPASQAGHAPSGDGWRRTSPVGSFGRTTLGLADMGGNVWEWTASPLRPYDRRDEPDVAADSAARVTRGGSFLCREDFCHGYRVSARSGTAPGTALVHTGFRLVRDVPAPAAGAR